MNIKWNLNALWYFEARLAADVANAKYDAETDRWAEDAAVLIRVHRHAARKDAVMEGKKVVIAAREEAYTKRKEELARSLHVPPWQQWSAYDVCAITNDILSVLLPTWSDSEHAEILTRCLALTREAAGLRKKTFMDEAGQALLSRNALAALRCTPYRSFAIVSKENAGGVIRCHRICRGYKETVEAVSEMDKDKVDIREVVPESVQSSLPSLDKATNVQWLSVRRYTMEDLLAQRNEITGIVEDTINNAKQALTKPARRPQAGHAEDGLSEVPRARLRLHSYM
jgi:hypothetical protein